MDGGTGRGAVSRGDPGRRRAGRHRVVVAAMAAALLVLSWLEVRTWVDRTWAFVSSVALIVALALLVDWLADLVLPDLWRVLASVGPRVAQAVSSDPELSSLLARAPRFDRWLRERLSTEKWNGWHLTATVLLAAWFLSWFADLSWNLAFGSALVTYDPGVSGLLQAIRTPELTRVMWVSSLLGSGLVVIALTAVAAVLLVMWGRRLYAAYLVGVVASGAALNAVVKLVAHRPRPPLEMMLVRDPVGYSFPSGHSVSSFLLFGALALLIAREVPTVRRRLVTVTLTTLVVAMVGVSRVYLGVHWPTDVLAAWALGGCWLTLWSGALVTWQRYGKQDAERLLLTSKTRLAITATVSVLAVGAVLGAAASDPVLARAVRPQPVRPLAVVQGPGGLTTLPRASVEQLPRFSEKLDGSRQEPIGMIFIGSRRQLVDAFESAGWKVADQATVASVLRTGLAAALNQPYETAPVTPTFLDMRVQDLAFEEETSAQSARVRHHTRFWLTRWTADGAPVWVATASFDEGIAIGSAMRVPTHRIAPDIDAERDYIARDLRATGLVAESGMVRVSPPSSGTNAQGDVWFTQGLAVVLVAR